MSKRKSKTKRKNKKISKRKNKKIVKRKVKKVLKKKNKTIKSSDTSETIIKIKPEWVKASLANKLSYQKKYNDSIKTIMIFGKRRKKNNLDKTV